jgi:ABC-type transporter Mla MlaB component
VAHPSMPEQPNTIILAVDSLDPDEVPDLIERLGPGIVRGDSTIILCDLARLADADIATVDALARLALRARRMGCAVTLRDPSTELLELVGLAGLGEVLPCAPASGLEVIGQPEEREEPLGVEEERDAGDPAVAELEHLD